jgi:hypothetical protein
MDRNALILLLQGHHFNMAERIERGIWPHPPLRLAEVLAILTDCIRNNEWFPREELPRKAHSPVNEMGTIQRIEANHFIYRRQRAHPMRPTLVAETVEKIFFTAEDAAAYYALWDLHLPGDLDGWKIVED